MLSDEIYMRRCLQLAANGSGNVAPNPLVGCVIVHNDSIIGEGYHAVFGGPHAEVNAIESVKEKHLIKDSTLYVNLEPCSHFGKTPPCADLIIKNNIPKVVIGIKDPHEKVAGKGIEKLISAGIQVKTGILEKDCLEINKRFVTYHTKKRPYIILKWAQTADGYIDKIKRNSEPYINWITDENTRILVHRWRAEEQAILVGANTVLKDNPRLTTREWYGKNPLRIVIDKNLAVPRNAHIFNDEAQTLIFNSIQLKTENNIEFVKINFSENILPQILSTLYDKEIQSVIVEGGSITLQSFIDNHLWDEARIFTGNIRFNDGIKAPAIKGNVVSATFIQNDKLEILKPL